jgi:GTP-binding protein EngB required for normal cell division
MIATKSILVIGRPKRGKSSILSTLIDGDPSNIMFIKRNGYGTEWVETLLFETDHPYRFIEAPGFVDGVTKNGLDIKKEWFE